MTTGKFKIQVSRRRFLKGAAVAAPSIAASSALGAWQDSGSIPPKWDMETDIVILGTGFGGLSAAITAKDAGARVLILEKMAQKYEGGNSKVSGNMWWTPTNLPEALEYIDAMCYGLTDRECVRSPKRSTCSPTSRAAPASAKAPAAMRLRLPSR